MPSSMDELIRVLSPQIQLRLKSMGEKTQENLAMGYSAAYPMGAERCL